MNGLLTVTSIKESFWKARHTVKDCISGRMVRYTMESGYLVPNKDMVFGKEPMGSLTSVSGRVAKLMDMACMSGLMEIDMKESGSHVSDMGTERISSPMVTCILDNTHMGSRKDTDNTNG